MRVAGWTAAIVLILDQIAKYYILHVLWLDALRAIDVWPPFFNLRMAWNRGVNFGLLAGDGDLMRWILIAVALGISAAVWIWVRRQPYRLVTQISAGLLVGGALGNVIDRLLYGAVVDFINMSCCGITNPYAFNIADIAIFAGAIGLVLFSEREKSR